MAFTTGILELAVTERTWAQSLRLSKYPNFLEVPLMSPRRSEIEIRMIQEVEQ
jgi:hypothetical protein